MPLAADLAIAHELTDIAADIGKRWFGSDAGASYKTDGTPVTAADIEIETALVKRLNTLRPDDAILTEESGPLGSGNRRWIIDPLDGTWNFLAGRTSWGTHVALETDHIVLGVVSRPMAGERWWALEGRGAFKGISSSQDDATQLRVSGAPSLEDGKATIWGANLNQDMAGALFQGDATFEDILKVAEGSQVACIDCSGKPWDLAPYVCIVEEAGGLFSDLGGGRSIMSGGGMFSNGHVHDELQRAFAAVQTKPT